MIIARVLKKVASVLRLLGTNFESLDNLMMLYIGRKVLASLVKFSNVTKRVVANTAAVDRV